MSAGNPGRNAARRRRWAAIVALVGATSVSIVIAIELTTARAYGWGMRSHVASLGVGTLALTSMLVAILILGLVGLAGRLRRAIPLAIMVAALVLTANRLKIQFRGEPLYPTDFAFVAEANLLISSVGVGPVLAGFGLVLVAGILAWLGVLGLGRLLRIPPAPRRDAGRWVLGARLLTVASAALLSILMAGFSADSNPVHRAYARIGAHWVVWSQEANYSTNGFFAGFLYNMPSAPMQQPDGYSRESVLEATERYAEKSREINDGRAPAALADTNVVVILGESFMDPAHLTGLELAEDPIPFTRRLMADTMSGTMRSVAFGGGTANVEFEVLTGMSTSAFANTTTPYQGLVANTDYFPSVLSRFEGTHTTVGIHPFQSDFYRRGDVYRSLGFDRTTFEADMQADLRVSEEGYIADAAAYAELLGHLRVDAEPVFAQVVTMQNHAGYAGLYPDPIPVLEPASARESTGLTDYLRGLKHADEALEGLLAGLQDLDRPTVVIFYGDHAPPAVIPDDLWDAQENPAARYHTPWFVWSTDGVHPIQHQGELSPTHLWNQMLRAMDAPVTPWDALLLELEAANSVQALSTAGNDSTAARLEDLERDHLLLQYDMAVGAGHGTEALLTVREA